MSNTSENTSTSVKESLEKLSATMNAIKERMENNFKEQQRKDELKLQELVPNEQQFLDYCVLRTNYLPCPQDVEKNINDPIKRVDEIINLLKNKLDNLKVHPKVSYGKIMYYIPIEELYRYFDYEIELAIKIAQLNNQGEKIWDIETFTTKIDDYSVAAGFILEEVDTEKEEKEEQEK